jgi:hypothetical protein
MGMPMSFTPTPGGVGPGGMGFGGGPGQPGGGPLLAVIDGNKKRYLEVTKQVRRMPVGIVVVVDQAYMQDMLLAFANSPLRFQITQVNWTRFRDTLSGIGGSGGGLPGEGISYGSGQVNFSGSPDPDGPRPSRGSSPMSFTPSPPPMSFTPPPMSFTPPPMSFTPPPGSMGPGMAGPGYPGSGYPGSSYPGSYGPSTVSESQITSSLVELSIYGIVSLYEKYEAPKPPGEANATTPAGTTPTTPMPTTPMPEMPMTPMPTTPTPPKMRRRVRA